MIYHEMNELPTLPRIADRVLRWGIIDTVLGGICGGIFGGVFGGLGEIIHFSASPILSIVGYFSLCGAVAGALVGTCGVIIDDADLFELRRPSPKSPGGQGRKIERGEDAGAATTCQPQARTAFDLTNARRPREVAAARQPLWN